ncbi:MAG: hypothetical protein MJZ60_07815 [Bacteroidaceae bacterium]|nr:hypothetical protein [Bacteroidaceae bacterium]
MTSDWHLSMMDGTFDKLLNESDDTDSEDIPSDFLKVLDFDTAMDEIKQEIDRWQKVIDTKKEE